MTSFIKSFFFMFLYNLLFLMSWMGKKANSNEIIMILWCDEYSLNMICYSSTFTCFLSELLLYLLFSELKAALLGN